jgi:hypothetical protein
VGEHVAGRRRCRLLSPGGYVVSLSHNQLNPDGVAYIQNARHYAEGRLDLAVNSYWGPLLSWLLIPAAWVKADEAMVVKCLGIVLGLVFAARARSLAGKLGYPQHRSLAFAAALMLAICMLPEPITPDLLMAAVLTWYMVLSVELLWGGSAASAFGVGVLGGVAYWVKAYALPFVFVHLCVTFAMRWWHARRRGAHQSAASLFAAAVAGQLLVALPWVVIISAHDGSFTTGSSGRLTRAAFSPVYVDGKGPLPALLLQRPRIGRVTGWENPVEIPGNWSEWSPLDGARGAKLLLVTVFREGIKTLRYLKNADALGILLSGWLILLCLYMKSGLQLTEKKDTACLWACITVGVYAGGYTMIHSEPRFFWAVWGIMLAAAIAAFARLGGKSDGLHVAAMAPDSTPSPRSRLARNCLAGILQGIGQTNSSWHTFYRLS